jgi:hypothetical protein
LLIGLVSEYDVFLSELIRMVITKRPEILASSEKVDPSRVLEFSNRDEAFEYLIEREIESIMVGKNHLDQLKALSKLSGAAVDLNDEAVRNFLEICERRNLFAHTGGVVTELYMQKCKAFKINLPETIKPSVQIPFRPKYFTNAVGTLQELCIKLCHFIWCKVTPDEHKLADAAIHAACFDIIRFGDTAVARRILHYVINQTAISSKIMRLRFILLHATALKLSGDVKLAYAELDKEEWLATDLRYQILAAAIKDDKETVFNLMKKTVNSGQVTLEDFRTWPAFGPLRSNLTFQEHIRNVFGKELIVGLNLPVASAESS